MTDVDSLIVPRPMMMLEASKGPRTEVEARQKRHEILARLYHLYRAGERRRTVCLAPGSISGSEKRSHQERSSADFWGN